MCNCMVLDVTAIFFWITAFLKKLPFLAKCLGGRDVYLMEEGTVGSRDLQTFHTHADVHVIRRVWSATRTVVILQ